MINYFKILSILFLSLTFTKVMAEEHPNYLTNKSVVDTLTEILSNGTDENIIEFFLSKENPEQIVRTWVSAQCDVNNINHDPYGSARIGLQGIEYCLLKGYKKPAAMMMHNICAFFMPEFDENVDPKCHTMLLETARKQVELRREIEEQGPVWALWTLGLAESVTGHHENALKHLSEGADLALERNDANAEAWCRLFIGKIKIRSNLDSETGKTEMLNASSIILNTGADWEKEEVSKILSSVSLSN